MPFTAPDTFLSGAVAIERKWDCTILDLARVKAPRSVVDGAKLMPDIELFCRYIRESANVLELAASNEIQFAAATKLVCDKS